MGLKARLRVFLDDRVDPRSFADPYRTVAMAIVLGSLRIQEQNYLENIIEVGMAGTRLAPLP